MIRPPLSSVRASSLRRSWESRRSDRSDPGASWGVDFRERHSETAAGDGLWPHRAVAPDSGLDRTTTYSAQATTILTPTGHACMCKRPYGNCNAIIWRTRVPAGTSTKSNDFG